MASSDMTALMLQIIKQMQEQYVTQEMQQEQQRAADERQRQFMAAILERRADQTPAATRSTIEKSPTIKTDFQELYRELEDCTMWSKIHRVQLSAPWMCRCAYGNRGRRNKGKPRRFRLRQRRPGPITQSVTSPGFIGHFMQGSRVRYCVRKSQPARHGPSSCSTTRPADSRSADVSPLIST